MLSHKAIVPCSCTILERYDFCYISPSYEFSGDSQARGNACKEVRSKEGEFI